MMDRRAYKGNKAQLIFFLISLVLITIGVLTLSRIIIPFGIAYIVTLIVQPLRRAMGSVSLRRRIAAIMVAVLTSFIFVYPVVEGIKTIKDESHKIEYYIPKLEQYLREKYQVLKIEVKDRFNYEIEANPVDTIFEYGKQSTKTVLTYVPYILTSLLEWGFVIPLFIFFILRDGRRIRFKFLKIIPNNIVERAYYLFHQFNRKFGDYIFAKFIEAVIVGSVITAGLAIIGYPFAFLLGVVAAITNILPYIGPILGFAPALIIGLIDQNPQSTLGAMIILYVVANVIDLAIVFPLLVSKIVNLHPLIVVISVIIGSQIAGIVGMIISIPLAAFFQLFIRQVYLEIYTSRR
jgi:putative permease